MNFSLLHPADQLVMIMDRIYRFGMTTTSGGNLSILDDAGDLWITPSGVDKGSLTHGDIICIKKDGRMVGRHKPSVELPFHQHIYEIRPDIRAIVHAHPPGLVAFSLVRRAPEVHLTPDVTAVCGKVGMAAYEVPGSAELGERIAERFEQGCGSVMMENHGCVIGGNDLFHAFKAFETLEFCARLEIDALKLGKPRALNEDQIALHMRRQTPAFDEFVPRVHESFEREARQELCELIHRAYAQRLFSSTQGTFSRRLADGSFLITPYNVDRMYLEPQDIVRMKNGMRESGKTPSRSASLHAAIYEKHPDVGSVLIAHPPAIMAFAVTDTVFDSRTIPESYINLRDVRKLPFGSSFLDIEKTASEFSEKTPVLLVENDCALVVGKTLLHAFDRLEVAEYSARALISTRELGEVVAINDEQVATINKAFGLT